MFLSKQTSDQKTHFKITFMLFFLKKINSKDKSHYDVSLGERSLVSCTNKKALKTLSSFHDGCSFGS